MTKTRRSWPAIDLVGGVDPFVVHEADGDRLARVALRHRLRLLPQRKGGDARVHLHHDAEPELPGVVVPDVAGVRVLEPPLQRDRRLRRHGEVAQLQPADQPARTGPARRRGSRYGGVVAVDLGAAARVLGDQDHTEVRRLRLLQRHLSSSRPMVTFSTTAKEAFLGKSAAA